MTKLASELPGLRHSCGSRNPGRGLDSRLHGNDGAGAPLALDPRDYPGAQGGTPRIPPLCKDGPRGISISPTRGRCTGFTIVEFIVALVLVGIGLALSIGLISSRDWREGYNLTNMANAFQTTLQMARARAVARQGSVPTAWHFGDPTTRYGGGEPNPTWKYGDLYKVSLMRRQQSDLASDPQMATWTSRGQTPPRYGSQVFFSLDHVLDGTPTRDLYGPEMWFYFDWNPRGDGSVEYQLNLWRAPGSPLGAPIDPNGTDAVDKYAIYFDPRGFAAYKEPAPSTAIIKSEYRVQIKCRIKDSGGTLQDRSEVWFQVTPMGKVNVMERQGS